MVQKNIVNLFWGLLFFCACFLLPPDKTKKANISSERFTAWAVNNRKEAIVNFAIDSEVVYCAKIHPRVTNPDVWSSRYRDCACNFPAVKYFQQKANIYELIQAYQDSQLVHQDTFLHICENTDAINQALIIANIKTGEYSKAEIAAILKKWGEPSNQTVGTGLTIDTLIRNFKDTSLNRYWGDLEIRNNVFVSNYDSIFTHLQNIVLKLNCKQFLYAYATEKDTALNMKICEQLRLNMQPTDTNFVLITDYYPLAYYKMQREKCLCADCEIRNYTTKFKNLSELACCLPAFIYHFEIYDKNGFVQVKKKILNGYNLFLH